MFKLTKEEQLIVAFLVGVLLLGTVVKEWRARRAAENHYGKTELR